VLGAWLLGVSVGVPVGETDGGTVVGGVADEDEVAGELGVAAAVDDWLGPAEDEEVAGVGPGDCVERLGAGVAQLEPASADSEGTAD